MGSDTKYSQPEILWKYRAALLWLPLEIRVQGVILDTVVRVALIYYAKVHSLYLKSEAYPKIWMKA